MAKISDRDLAKPMQVLGGKIPLSVAATDFSVKESTLLGVAILWLGGWRRATRKRGEFGLLLERLVRWPGDRSERIRRLPYDEKPTWYGSKSSSSLVGKSHNLGLHTSGDRAGNGLILDPPQSIRELATKKLYVQTAVKFYEQACAELGLDLADAGSPAPNPPRPETSSGFQKSIRLDLELTRVAEQLAGLASSPTELWALYARLREILYRNVPEGAPPVIGFQ